MYTEKDFDKVVALVKETKALIFNEMKSEKVTVKGAADYVTNVDYAVQEFLKEKLGNEFPEVEMIAEEKENLNLREDGLYWILDPIDGTTNLIHDYHMSAVSLGLYDHGDIIFGVVYNPFTEELFSAIKGKGAFLNGKEIHVSSTKELKDAVISYGSSPYEKNRGEALFKIFYNIFMNCADFRRTGSAALDLCYIACGRQHGYIEQNLKPWDYAAGSLILQEAGGIAKDWNGEKLPFLKNADVFSCAAQFEEILYTLIK